ncbi:Os04g0249801 [Oryza sativa Japonica Group]|uniref:Os04g0249801 protein n=1 Tax=Oryza sativa subsp. japonica TaxID=39947 RepID=A0A0P0W880_ORYSJ|nr:Os04g0249801 [Oryza sativa Japonica Group]
MEREGWSGHPYPLHSPPLSLDNVGKRAAPSLTVSDGALPTVSDGALPTASSSDDALPHHERKRRCPPPSLVAAAKAPPSHPSRSDAALPTTAAAVTSLGRIQRRLRRQRFPMVDPMAMAASAASCPWIR